jgi:hypothetical protein
MEELTPNIRQFILWLCDLHCPFITHYNGEDKTMPKISYDKGNKNYTLDEVFQYWWNNVKVK